MRIDILYWANETLSGERSWTFLYSEIVPEHSLYWERSEIVLRTKPNLNKFKFFKNIISKMLRLFVSDEKIIFQIHYIYEILIIIIEKILINT